MEMRVEELSGQTGVPVDTIRYYQSKGLLDPPRRQGRVAWYDDGHRERLARVRSLQQRGFTLATIARLLSGELDAADEVLVGELSGVPRTPGGAAANGESADAELIGGTAQSAARSDGVATSGTAGAVDTDGAFTLDELATETGVPLALLKALEAEGLLIPRRIGGHERYTTEDVAASKAGLLLLEWGIPLSSLLDLARRHHEATVVVAEEAVAMFSIHVRDRLRHDRAEALEHDRSDPEVDVDQLLRAYSELLPAVDALVGHHFTRTLVKVALDHVEQAGSAEEQRAIWEQLRSEGTPVDDPDGTLAASSARSATVEGPTHR
jgi:DNA-binding transcriptional MerR regulator